MQPPPDKELGSRLRRSATWTSFWSIPGSLVWDNKGRSRCRNELIIQVAHTHCASWSRSFLIQQYRPANKRAQDVLYIYDTIELFPVHCWTGIQCALEGRQVAPALWWSGRWRAKISTQTFAEVNDMIRDAARIPADRDLPPEQIRQRAATPSSACCDRRLFNARTVPTRARPRKPSTERVQQWLGQGLWVLLLGHVRRPSVQGKIS